MALPEPPTVLSANFLMEVRPRSPLPPPGPPEIAIAGRSNVGKSTLLNRLVGRRALARTSKTPGRTRGIMFYDLVLRLPGQHAGVSRRLRLVDLPGYGYAQVSQEERKSWQPMIEGYVEKRDTLALFLTLIDARRDLGDEERQLIEWLDSSGRPPAAGGDQGGQADRRRARARWATACAAPSQRDCPRRCWSRARPGRASTACGPRITRAAATGGE